MFQSFLESLDIFYKTKHELTLQLKNDILRHLSQKNKNLSSHTQKNLYTNMFIAPLSVTAPKQEIVELPLGGEWLINCGTHTKECCSSIKANELLTQAIIG